MRTTLRMREKGSSLDGYIFSDREHARQWLRQPCINREAILVEPVEVSPLVRCTKCSGEGFHQTVKAVGGKMTAAEFLRESNDG